MMPGVAWRTEGVAPSRPLWVVRPPLPLVLVLLGCGSPGESGAPDTGAARRTAAAVGVIVAHVDGEPIALADVEDVVRRTGLSPSEALRRIEDETLLYAAATAAGTTPDDEDERTVRRAMVQAYLRHEIEDAITPETLDPAAVQERIARDRRFFSSAEVRRSTNVLVRFRDGAARARAAPTAEEASAMRTLAEGIRDTLRSVPDPAAVAAERYAHDATDEGSPYEVLVEAIPPTAADGAFDDTYLAALFALDPSSPVSEPVTTSFGVHVIVLGEIVPPWSTPEGEVETIIRRQLVAEARADALVALEDRLWAEGPPVLDERAIDALLDTDLTALER